LGKWEVRNFNTVSPTNVPASATCEYFHKLLMMQRKKGSNTGIWTQNYKYFQLYNL
jgi:hypothetical protein